MGTLSSSSLLSSPHPTPCQGAAPHLPAYTVFASSWPSGGDVPWALKPRCFLTLLAPGEACPTASPLLPSTHQPLPALHLASTCPASTWSPCQVGCLVSAQTPSPSMGSRHAPQISWFLFATTPDNTCVSNQPPLAPQRQMPRCSRAHLDPISNQSSRSQMCNKSPLPKRGSCRGNTDAGAAWAFSTPR